MVASAHDQYQGGSCVAPELTTRFGAWFSSGANVRPNSVARIYPGIQDFPVGGIRLQLQRAGGPRTGWKMSVRNGAGRLLALFDAADFDATSGSLWTGRLVAGEVYLELISPDQTVRVKVVQGIAAPAENNNQPQLYSLQDGSSPKWKFAFEAGSVDDDLQLKLADTVGMMHTASERAGGGVGMTRKSWCCSGVMIASDLYLTNDHCGGMPIAGSENWDQAQCDATLIDLGWEQDGIPRQFACRKVEAHDSRLDFAIIRLTPVAGSEAGRGGSRAAPTATGLVSLNQPLFMIHHASCQFKRISQPCAATARRRAWTDGASATDRPEFEHTCDSEPGASGAPIFDGAGQLVGLHHLGFETCGGVSDRRNKAVGIAAIRAKVVDSNKALARELGWN
ncbi:trypsin-like serine peptidase [Sphingomonas sp. MMS24-J45]|uniref:trypsin-like serine peptidase n=1 Tax=Sphingomonas sp. MMS24-J45 TaxID=3238806 RepID=UPI00384D3B3B